MAKKSIIIFYSIEDMERWIMGRLLLIAHGEVEPHIPECIVK